MLNKLPGWLIVLGILVLAPIAAFTVVFGGIQLLYAFTQAPLLIGGVILAVIVFGGGWLIDKFK